MTSLRMMQLLVVVVAVVLVSLAVNVRADITPDADHRYTFSGVVSGETRGYEILSDGTLPTQDTAITDYESCRQAALALENTNHPYPNGAVVYDFFTNTYNYDTNLYTPQQINYHHWHEDTFGCNDAEECPYGCLWDPTVGALWFGPAEPNQNGNVGCGKGHLSHRLDCITRCDSPPCYSTVVGALKRDGSQLDVSDVADSTMVLGPTPMADASVPDKSNLDCNLCAEEIVKSHSCEDLLSDSSQLFGAMAVVNNLPVSRGACFVSCTPWIASYCYPCADDEVRDCTDPRTCWPHSWVGGELKDCGGFTGDYPVDFSCYPSAASECPLPAGCDGVAGSGMEEDECGVCGGKGKSCKCDGGECDVLLSISPEDLTQTTAVVSHCSSLHFRGYQFQVVGARLSSWSSAIHEIDTRCSVFSGICVGFGYTAAFGYDTYHIAANDGTDSCKSPLVHLTFSPTSSEISLENVKVGGDYDFLVGGFRTSVPFPMPQVNFFWFEVSTTKALLVASSDTDLNNLAFRIEFQDCFESPTADAHAIVDSETFALSTCTQLVNTVTGNLVLDCQIEEVVDAGTNAPMVQINLAADNSKLGSCRLVVTSALDLVHSSVVPTGGTDESPTYVVPVHTPEPLALPLAELAVVIPDASLETANVVLRVRGDTKIRGCQFYLRGVDVKTNTVAGFQNYYREDYPENEYQYMTFNMNNLDGLSGGEHTILTVTYDKQHSATAELVLKDIRCASDSDHVTTGTAYGQDEAKLNRCDSRWPGLCDQEDADGDGCINIDDFAPQDDGAGCGSCGDLSGDHTMDILDVVKAVRLVTSGNFHVVADTDGDQDNDEADILKIREWVTDPLGDAHPLLPICQ